MYKLFIYAMCNKCYTKCHALSFELFCILASRLHLLLHIRMNNFISARLIEKISADRERNVLCLCL